MKIKNLLLISLISLFGCKNENKKDILPTVSKLDTVVKSGIPAKIYRVDMTPNKDTFKITRETLKKGSRKVIFNGKTYYKKNKGDYCIERRADGDVYTDIITYQNYDIVTKKAVSIDLSEKD
jgi:hypothetical protein